MTTEAQAPATIPIAAPVLGADVEELVVSVLRTGHLAQGPMVERFEELCAAMAGTAHAVALSNGTVALDAALELSGIRPGDEVVTTPFTFAATLNAVLRRRAIARFADITGDFTIDPASVATLMNPRTKVLLPVHLFGQMSDMDALSLLAQRYGAAVIEDAAQAHGATQRGRPAGSYGMGCFSFYGTKNVAAGEGGCLTTDDGAAADRLRVLRNQGMRGRYDYLEIGMNWRMTDVAAAIAIPQLLRLRDTTRLRRWHAARLTELLSVDERIETPCIAPWRAHVWHQYTVLLPEECDRNEVIHAMARDGVQTGVYYPRLVWDYPPFRAHPGVIKSDTPRAHDAAARCLSLPVHAALQPGDVERIASSLLTAVAETAPVIRRPQR